MRICIWTSSVFKLGGTKRVVTMLANKLTEQHEVTILTFDSPQKEDRTMYGLDSKVNIEYIQSQNFRDHTHVGKALRSVIKRINNKTGFFNKAQYVELIRDSFYPKFIREKWIKYINSFEFDVVIATAGLSLHLAVIADEIKAKTLGWQHSCYDAYVNQKGVLFWKKDELLKKYFAKLDAVIVLSDYDKDAFKKNLGITCVSIGNPRSFVSEEKTDITQKNFFIASRFEKAKGLEFGIEAFAKFCTVDDEWNLIIAGDGRLRKKIIDLVWKYGIQERVRFVGTTSDVKKYYLQSSVYLLPSRWEGWGLVIIEAFEMGMPVVAFDVGPIDLLITSGVDGIVVPKYNVDMFAAAMTKLAHDEELRTEMSKHVSYKAEKYSDDAIAKEWINLLEGLNV